MKNIVGWFKKLAQIRPDSTLRAEDVQMEFDPVNKTISLHNDDFAISMPVSDSISKSLTIALTKKAEDARKASISDQVAKEIATRLMAGKGNQGKDWNFDWDGKTLVLGVYKEGRFEQTQELTLDQLKKSFPNAVNLV